MEAYLLDWASLLEILRNSQRVVLTSHVRPDCDALGSELGMAGILEALGKHVRIVNAQATPPTLAWIDPHKRIESLAEGVKKASAEEMEFKRRGVYVKAPLKLVLERDRERAQWH